MSETCDVSIITRTKDRKLFLERAAESIAAQTETPFEWIIVNDGGEKIKLPHLKSIVGHDISIVLIENEVSQGRSKAANAGVAVAKGSYLLIHDDDDTLEPDFLKETSSFLRHYPEYIGVVAHTQRVDEELDENSSSIKITKCHSENFFLKNIKLSELLQKNLFSPISLLVKRTAFLESGGYPEDLDVLEDYYFNIMLLLKCGDIGVLPKHLANHHFRWKAHHQEAFNNTVTVGIEEHYAAEAKLKNRLLRDDLLNNNIGLGLLWAQADMTVGGQEVRNTLNNLGKRLEKSSLIRSARYVASKFFSR